MEKGCSKGRKIKYFKISLAKPNGHTDQTLYTQVKENGYILP